MSGLIPYEQIMLQKMQNQQYLINVNLQAASQELAKNNTKQASHYLNSANNHMKQYQTTENTYLSVIEGNAEVAFGKKNKNKIK